MSRKWLVIGLTVGLLPVAITGGAVLASGGNPDEGDGERVEEVVVEDGDVSTLSTENAEVGSGEPDELAVRVAEILGTDPQATYDAMLQADQIDLDHLGVDDQVEVGDEDSWSEHAEGLSYMEYGERVGAILGLDGEMVARAIAKAYEELYAVERDIWDNGSGRDAEGKYDSDKNPAEPAA